MALTSSPAISYLKIGESNSQHVLAYTDASLKGTELGIGIIILDDSQNVVYSRGITCNATKLTNIVEAELLGIRAIIEKCITLNIVNIEIHTDSSESLASIFHNKDLPTIKRIKKLLSKVESLTLKWIPRKENAVANGIARHALNLKTSSLPGLSYKKLSEPIFPWNFKTRTFAQNPE